MNFKCQDIGKVEIIFLLLKNKIRSFSKIRIDCFTKLREILILKRVDLIYIDL